MLVRLGIVAAAAALVVVSVNGFVPQPSARHVSSRSSLLPSSTTSLREAGDPTGFDSAVPVAPYGEQQRKFRRTVYSHDDWKKHRSQDRFFNYLARAFRSGVYKNMDREVAIVTIVASVAVVYNIFATGYTGLDGVQYGAIIEGLPKMSLPLNAFTVTSPSLGLLLGKSSLVYLHLFSVHVVAAR